MRQPLAVPRLLRCLMIALQQAARWTARRTGESLAEIRTYHVHVNVPLLGCTALLGCAVLYCCRYIANMAVAAVSLAGLLGLAAWFAYNLHYTRLERSSWWVGGCCAGGCPRWVQRHLPPSSIGSPHTVTHTLPSPAAAAGRRRPLLLPLLPLPPLLQELSENIPVP